MILCEFIENRVCFSNQSKGADSFRICSTSSFRIQSSYTNKRNSPSLPETYA